jgi:Kazal-type serine protease inhibitor domain
MENSTLLLVITTAVISANVIAAEQCNFDCSDDLNPVCAAPDHPNKLRTIKTFASLCHLIDFNCRNPLDGNEN